MSDIGINFRATSGYVTDPANTTYCLDTDGYPTTRGGFTFGALSGSASNRDRNTGADPRLAGMAFNATAPKVEYELDIPSGSYDIQLAAGDYNYAFASNVVEVLNDTSSLFTISGACSGSDRWLDALGAPHDITWVPSSAEAQTGKNISSGLLKFKIGDGSSGNSGRLSHIRATSTAGGGVFGSNFYRQVAGLGGGF